MTPYDIKLYKSLAPLIRDYRQWRDLSQETFAASIGISVRELRRWEANRYRARVDNLHDLSEATGIPMQACIALNADQPIWYALGKRRFAYSSVELTNFISELFKCRTQSDDGIVTRHERITTDKHISSILSCHRDIYGTGWPLARDVIKAASTILSDLNIIVYDCWGHYVGHQVCFPLEMDVYRQLKKQKAPEAYLTPGRMGDILALHEGVFFYYTFFAASGSIAHPLFINNVRYMAEMEPKEGYRVAGYLATTEAKEICNVLGYKMVFTNERDEEHPHTEIFPAIYEIRLDDLISRFRRSEVLRWVIEEVDGKARATEKRLTYTLAVDSALVVDKREEDDPKGADGQQYKLKIEACPNPKCTLSGQTEKGNIVSNGTYRTKEGSLSHRFLCKECGKSFCSRARSVFYGLRSSDKKVFRALQLLVKGMPLNGVAKDLGVNFRTIQRWLRVLTEQSENIDAMLIKELKVSKAELDTLWRFVKKNSLRQRAILWKARANSVSQTT